MQTVGSEDLKDDAAGKQSLRSWPRWTAVWNGPGDNGCWLRAQPPDGVATGPRLESPGSDGLFRTQPDGLWIYLDPHLRFADAIAVEVCANRQNLYDKRSRYMPSTGSTIVRLHAGWLDGKIQYKKGERTRALIAGIKPGPVADAALPVRHIRVLFALEPKLYEQWRTTQAPQGHEWFCPYSSLRTYNAPPMQGFLRQLRRIAHFYVAKQRTRGR